MVKNSSVNLGITLGDGFTILGGTTPRSLQVTSGNVVLTASGSNVFTFPTATDTLVGLVASQTLTNKLLSLSANSVATASLTIGVSGAAPTTLSTGQLWWNGTQLYFYNGTTSKDLLSGAGGGAVTVVTPSTNTVTFPTAGKNYTVKMTFSGTGTFSDVGYDAVLSASNANFVVSPNYEPWTTGIASWTIYVPTDQGSYMSSIVLTPTLVGRGWSSGTTTGFAATWGVPVQLA